MSGKQHLVCGYTIVALSYAGLKITEEKMIQGADFDILQKTGISILQSACEIMNPRVWWLFPFCFCLFAFGLLFPDIDNPKSLIGRYCYAPIEHRTWIHTLWFFLLCSLPALFFYRIFNPVGLVFLWFAFGVFLHLFTDSFSKCGVCWLYPISKYRYYGTNGAKIKKHHVFILYTGDTSAWILCTVFVMLTLFVYYNHRVLLLSTIVSDLKSLFSATL